MRDTCTRPGGFVLWNASARIDYLELLQSPAGVYDVYNSYVTGIRVSITPKVIRDVGMRNYPRQIFMSSIKFARSRSSND